ncbi:peptidoglycan glycosyltransferase RodA [Paraliobacillus ryukyuensis]|uniref:Rod shape determining protein RodA n=1 Tax=Paraliobacillus ryukyuensis TaxID=200904 RepID=A0A366E793_9BACI|nr:FtsW/RodA/SpoVE family cell cycle protein [Paraliobacillus ryukyuensis]RBO98177.1 rod shape determining protein RodA [Paraliobacillus ryukyuensis]
MKKNATPKIDYTLILIVILLAIVSIFTLYTLEATLEGSYYLKQLTWYIIGSVAIGLIMLFDYDRLRQVAWILYGFGIVMLLMLFFHFPPGIANKAGGAWAWFQFGPISLQPAEFMKVFLIIALANLIVMHKEKFKTPTTKSDLWLLAKIVIVAIVPMLFIIKQPDLGGFLVLSSIVFCMLLVSGIRWRIILTMLGLAVIILGTIILLFAKFPETVEQFAEDHDLQYVEDRFTSWLDPKNNRQGTAFQVTQNILAIGSGQLSGKGIGEFEVSHVPERQTDFIFSAIGEQFGFIGSSALLVLFFLLIYRLIHIGLQNKDPFGSYIIAGMTGMFTYQIFQNIGMSIQLLPITGLPLPFISYGGSSTLTYMIAVGIVLNIHYRTKVYMFDS